MTHPLVDEIKRLATTYPETVYKKVGSTCKYLEGETESGHGRLIGQAVQNLYPHLVDKLKEADDRKLPAAAWTLLEHILPDMSRKCRDWCHNVQRQQDNGVKWGEIIN